MRSLNDLKNAESSWPVVEKMMKEASNKFELLPRDLAKADEALVQLQQSVESLMGAITYETGGILIDEGWIRILGSGHERLTRTIPSWNLGRSQESYDDTPDFLMVADDALGGIFAINGGILGEDVGNIYYLAPDTVEWEPLEVNYESFLNFCFKGQIDEFYGDGLDEDTDGVSGFRWDGWEKEVKKMSGDDAILFTPPLWAGGSDDLTERNRSYVTMEENFNILVEASELLSEDYDEFDEHEGRCGCGCGCDDEDEFDCGCGDEGCCCEDEDCDDDCCCNDNGDDDDCNCCR